MLRSSLVTTSRALAAFSLFAAACAARGAETPPPTVALRTAEAAPLADPTVHPPRIVPAELRADDVTFGVEPGGGLRTITSGVRVVNLPGGGVLSALDQLPQPPSATIAVPARMGGGFLFLINSMVWRADTWLAPLRRIYVAPMVPTRLFVGLDRAYVRLNNHAYAAFDPASGRLLDLGPWPGGPEVGDYLAVDGWRAVAVTDLRGLVATFDAGARWQKVPLPFEPTKLVEDSGAVAIAGPEAGKSTQWMELHGDGAVGRLTEAPTRAATPVVDARSEGPARVLGKRPLAAAVEDGWPLPDGTALVARDGTLARVRLADGRVVEAVADAYPLAPSRCHPIPLARPAEPGAFGFVCGEPHGRTAIYAWHAHEARLALLKQWDNPRAAMSSGNGAIVVHGACDADAADDATPGMHTYCVRGVDGTWRELDVRGEVGGERVVALRDGRTAILSPPSGDLATARLTLLDGAHATTRPLTFVKPVVAPGDDDDAAASEQHALGVLRSGTWMEGFEEREPGVLSGWVELSGTFLGVRVALDGKTKHGSYVKELGTVMVSGRYGVGWTASRLSFETTDGGMHWQNVTLPQPIDQHRRPGLFHGCGPVGCELAGWLRVGWGGTGGEDDRTADAAVPTVAMSHVPSPERLDLRCELVGKPSPPAANAAVSSYVGPRPYPRYGRYGVYGRYGYGQASDWSSFYAMEAPRLGTEEQPFGQRADDVFDRAATSLGLGRVDVGPLMHFYSWGPKGIEWAMKGKFVVRWTSPYEPSTSLHTTLAIPIPRFLVDATNFASLGGAPPHRFASASMVPGDDASHALMMVARHGYGAGSTDDTVAVELESDRAPVEITQPDGSLLGMIDSATRLHGKWYLAVPSTDPPEEVIYAVESGVARELLRLPRAGYHAQVAPPVRVARRADGSGLGAIVQGPPRMDGDTRPDRWAPQLWALPIDEATGATGEPERLGASDFSGMHLDVCGPADGGWVLDSRWPGGATVVQHDARSGRYVASFSSRQPVARYRLGPGTVCVEKLSTRVGNLAAAGPLPKSTGRAMDVAVFTNRGRTVLRCAKQ